MTELPFSNIKRYKYLTGLFVTDLYHIFRLYIASSIPLPAPSVDRPSARFVPDVVIEFGDTPEQLANPQSKGVWYQAAPGEFLLKVDSVARYYVSQGRRIIITPVPGVSREKILIFLMGSAFGALLHHRNVLVLHAGAIAVKKSSVIFLGPSGIGKSTLAAGFHQRGYPFLADDVCAITMVKGEPAVIPGFPRLKLWEDVLQKLGKDKNQLKSVVWTRNLEKYFMPVEHRYQKPVPLKAVFELETIDTDEIEITALKGGAKINPLIGNTYRLGFLDGLGGRKEHFQQCAAVAAQANVYRVARPRSGFLLDELMDALEGRF